MKSIFSLFLILSSIIAIVVLSSCAVPLPSYSTVNFEWKGNMENLQRDNDIFAKKLQKMIKMRYPDTSDVLVLSEKFHVLLVGQAKTLEIKNKIYEMVKSFPNIVEVHNFINISDKPNFIKNYSINRKVKRRIESEENLSQENIRSVTIDSVVYLLGTIYPYEKDNMISLMNGIYSIYGVKKVVDVTVIEDLSKLSN